MRAKKRNLHLLCSLFMLAILFVTSRASAAQTTEDVANQVQKAMAAGITAKDAVRSVVASAIAQGMSAKEAAEAATKGAVQAAVSLGLSFEEIARVIYACAQGAQAAAVATGQDAAAIAAGVESGALSAAEIHGLDSATLLDAAADGTADATTPPEAYSPSEMAPAPPAMPAHEQQSDPVEPITDPTASPV